MHIKGYSIVQLKYLFYAFLMLARVPTEKTGIISSRQALAAQFYCCQFCIVFVYPNIHIYSRQQGNKDYQFCPLCNRVRT